jgi:hypothetical protein
VPERRRKGVRLSNLADGSGGRGSGGRGSGHDGNKRQRHL